MSPASPSGLHQERRHLRGWSRGIAGLTAGQLGRPEGREPGDGVALQRHEHPVARVGGEAIAARQVAVAASSSQSSSTAVGSRRRYAVRQVTTWMRAISAASSGRAGRTETSAVPVARGNVASGFTRAA